MWSHHTEGKDNLWHEGESSTIRPWLPPPGSFSCLFGVVCLFVWFFWYRFFNLMVFWLRFLPNCCTLSGLHSYAPSLQVSRSSWMCGAHWVAHLSPGRLERCFTSWHLLQAFIPEGSNPGWKVVKLICAILRLLKWVRVEEKRSPFSALPLVSSHKGYRKSQRRTCPICVCVLHFVRRICL